MDNQNAPTTSKNKTIIILIFFGIIVLGLLTYFLYTTYQTKKQSNITDQAMQSLNPQLCEEIKISSYFISKDACYNSIAQKTNNKELCGKIQQKELKDNCYENIK